MIPNDTRKSPFISLPTGGELYLFPLKHLSLRDPQSQRVLFQEAQVIVLVIR